MIRILGFLVGIALLGFGIGWLADRPGSFTLVWQGWQIETSVPVALLGIVLLAAAVIVLFWFVRTIVGVPDAITDFFRGRRRQRGMTAVAHGLMAVGIGDGRAARRSANEARRLIGDEPLTLLLRAQAAQLAGDREEAESAFRAMLDQPETRPLGYRGLFVEARRRGDAVEAMSLAERAVKANPNVPWAGPALLELQGTKRDWDGALASVERNAANRLVEKSDARRQRAVLLTAKALDRIDRGIADEALDLATEAVKLAPDLVPAAALAARLYAEGGDTRRASKIVEAAWRAGPHPDLAEVYVHVRPGESALERLKRAEYLAKRIPDHPEGILALAQAALAAREFGRARTVLAPVAGAPTRRVCLLMAEIENAETGDLGRARAWLARGLNAARDPQWVADGLVSDTWEPVSPISGRLDAFEWKVPQESLTASTSSLIDQDIEVIVEPAPAPVTAAPKPAPAPQPAAPPPPPPPSAPPPPAPAPKVVRTPPSEVLLPLARAPDDPGPDDDEDETLPPPRPLGLTP
ncbi:membrane protein [Terrihabitans soli]|uniref:Membrane protein n=1 Tax=Terrihabitans soli TaxID=708113 RepID=A0A6S6QJV9_9HYPH|nr:heme biosynthesis HemY N-terminal domain-containing protein [Terrihabitans soli]BCJ89516.1 membrane protein [Terrihabitans soli]